MAPPSQVQTRPALTAPGIVAGAGLQTMVQTEPFSPGSLVAPVGAVHQGLEVQGFSAADFFESAGQINFVPGKTLFLIQDDFGGQGAADALIGCGNGNLFTARKGWGYEYVGSWAICGGGLDVANIGYVTTLSQGAIKVLAIRWGLDNHVTVSENGGAPVDFGFPAAGGAPLDGTCKTRIGVGIPGDTTAHFANGGILAFALSSSLLSDAELVAATSYGPNNRLRFTPSVTKRTDLEVLWEATVDWDGVQTTTVTRGSSPITLTRTGQPTLADVSEVRVPINSQNALDSFMATQLPGDVIYRESFSRVQFTTTGMRFGFDSVAPGSSSAGVYQNGAYLQSYNSVNGGNSGTPNCCDVVLNATGQKTVDVCSGQQSWGGGAGFPKGVTGAYLLALRLRTIDASLIRQDSQAWFQCTTVGDSIFDGFNNVTPQQFAWQQQARYHFSSQSAFANLCFGNQTFKGMSDGTCFTQPALISELQGLSTGTKVNLVIFQSVTNDYSAALETPAQHATRLQNVITALRAANIPNLQIVIWGAVQRIAPSSEAANGLGFTLQNYRDARQGVAAANSDICTYYVGNNVVSNANMAADGVHVRDAGDTQIANFLIADLVARGFA